MIGRVGDDDFGRARLRNLRELGIDTTHVIVDPEAATGIALITLDASGQNSIVLAPGANVRLTKEDINVAQDAIHQSDVLVLQLESPLEVVTYVIDIAHAEGVKVILNPAPAQPLRSRPWLQSGSGGHDGCWRCFRRPLRRSSGRGQVAGRSGALRAKSIQEDFVGPVILIYARRLSTTSKKSSVTLRLVSSV